MSTAKILVVDDDKNLLELARTKLNAATYEVTTALQGEEALEIVKVKQFVMKPMTPEEAALQMETLGHDFFFFHSADSDLPTVLYRRRDGAYGLIEPA